MADPIDVLTVALDRAARVRPAVGGFPYLAEVLRDSGFEHVHCDVAGGTMLYRGPVGAVVTRVPAQAAATVAVPRWDETALVAAIRADQRGERSFPEFLAGCWSAGVTGYDVDLAGRTCTYRSADPGRRYVEQYPAVMVAG